MSSKPKNTIIKRILDALAKFVPNSILSVYAAITNLNGNFTTISNLFDRVLFRDGTSPNAMSAPIDMNGNRINNVANGVNPSDAVNLSQLQAAGANAPLVFTATTDISSIPPGSAYNVVFFASGLRVADNIPLAAKFKGTLNGLMLFAHCNTDDNAIITIFNPTGSAIDLPNGTFVVSQVI